MHDSATINSLLATRLLKQAITDIDPRQGLAQIKAAVAELGAEMLAQAQKQSPDHLAEAVEGIEGLMRDVIAMLEANLAAAERREERQWVFEIERDDDGLISTIRAV